MTEPNDMLKVGDLVHWHPAWGFAPRHPVPQLVVNIEVQEKRMEAASWAVIREADEVYVDLANGHWAYGHQLAPVTEKTGGML